MLTVDQCRKILGKKAENLSDEQLARLRDQMYGLADVALTVFLVKERTSA
jgi:hypothetical protein